MGLAGFLLFQAQPLLAKYILPWFGGSASTWLVCLLFFQVALLAGYAYAYLVTLPLSLTRQVQVQLAVLLVSLLMLPITPADSWKPLDVHSPTWRILALLTACVGLPYLVLATTTPLLSRWLAHIEPSLDPARLFAASNIGSFIGLLSYPFVFERLMSSGQQTRWWSWVFALYAVLLVVCAYVALKGDRQRQEHQMSALSLAASPGDPLASWVFLSALGSILLLATTNAITQWAAVVPFLWIVPLSLYLLTFVIAFGDHRLYDRTAFGVGFLLLAGTTFFFTGPSSSLNFLFQLALQAATLFAGCMLCHAEIVRLRPEPARLPKFYLAIAAGGALGGILVALLAPFVFNDYFEHPLVLSAIGALAFTLMLRDAQARSKVWIAPAAYAAGLYFLGGVAAGTWEEIATDRNLVERVRNFYGVVKILRENKDDPEEYGLVMQQAGTDQGVQFQAPARKMEVVCGFNEASALGLTLAHHAKRRAGGPLTPLRIGVIGLGAGMVAGLGREGDIIRYYELNPAVLDLMNKHFTFVRDGKARIDIQLGDARLVLERQLRANNAQQFDVLVFNAFRGASPPLHLMTKEAFDIYLAHLAADGILAVNFEVETFEMAPLHRGMARELGLIVRWFETPEADNCEGPISWALYTRDRIFFEAGPVKAAISPWRDRSRSELVWSDSDHNLMSIINWSWD